MFITLIHYEKIPEETKTKINPKLWRRQVGPYCTFLINGKTKFFLTQGGKERGPVRITTGVRCIFLCLLSLERRGRAAPAQVARSRSQNSPRSLPTGSGSQNQARGFANIPFQSAAKRDYTELSSTIFCFHSRFKKITLLIIH